MMPEAGMEFAPLHAGLLQILDTHEAKTLLTGGLPLNLSRLIRKVMPMLRPMLEDPWAASQGIDLVIFHPLALAGRSIAEKLGIPGIMAFPIPLFSPTAAFACPALPVSFNRGQLNRLSHRLLIGGANTISRRLTRTWRREQSGLGPTGGELHARHTVGGQESHRGRAVGHPLHCHPARGALPDRPRDGTPTATRDRHGKHPRRHVTPRMAWTHTFASVGHVAGQPKDPTDSHAKSS